MLLRQLLRTYFWVYVTWMQCYLDSSFYDMCLVEVLWLQHVTWATWGDKSSPHCLHMFATLHTNALFSLGSRPVCLSSLWPLCQDASIYFCSCFPWSLPSHSLRRLRTHALLLGQNSCLVVSRAGHPVPECRMCLLPFNFWWALGLACASSSWLFESGSFFFFFSFLCFLHFLFASVSCQSRFHGTGITFIQAKNAKTLSHRCGRRFLNCRVAWSCGSFFF